MKKYSIVTLIMGIITLLVGREFDYDFKEFIFYIIIVWVVIMVLIFLFNNPEDKKKKHKKNIYNTTNDIKKIIDISVFIGIILVFGILIIYFSNKNMLQFKKFILNSLKEYDVSNAKITNMYLQDEKYRYGYFVVLKCNSSNFNEKQIYEYIDNIVMKTPYIQNDNYYYVYNLFLYVNNVKYEKYYSNTLKITENGKTYKYDINTNIKEELEVKTDSSNYNSNSNSNSSYIPFTDTDALVMAQDICESHLKAPSSAKWGYKVNITNLGNNKYSVSGTVESKNSYGVMISATYYAYFTFTGRGYTNGYCSILE